MNDEFWLAYGLENDRFVKLKLEGFGITEDNHRDHPDAKRWAELFQKAMEDFQNGAGKEG